MPRSALTAAQREDLADARLLVETASHNVRLSLDIAVEPAALATAVQNAETQLDQALASLRRVRAALSGRS